MSSDLAEAEASVAAVLEAAAHDLSVKITEVKITIIAADSGGYPGTPVRSSEPRARVHVRASGNLNGSTKAAILRALEGEDLPSVGRVAGVRADTSSREGWWAEAVLDLEMGDLDIPKAALSPFGGPMKLTGRQHGWLLKRGYPVPDIGGGPLEHAHYATGDHWSPSPLSA